MQSCQSDIRRMHCNGQFNHLRARGGQHTVSFDRLSGGRLQGQAQPAGQVRGGLAGGRGQGLVHRGRQGLPQAGFESGGGWGIESQVRDQRSL